VLPLSKRPRQVQLSGSDLVHTDEIEVVSERAPRSTRRPIDRRPISYPSLPAPVPAPRSWAQARQRTIVPPAVRPHTPFSQSDDEMTVLMGHRPLTGFGALSRRQTPVSLPPPRSMMPTPTPFPCSLDRESRLAVTGPAHRRSENPPAPDSLRPVEMFAAGGAGLSGRHDAPPMAITMHAPEQAGRPTLTWAAALIVIGGLVGLGSALFAQVGAVPTASSPPSSVQAPMAAAAAAQPQTESHAPEAAAPAPPPPVASAAPVNSGWVTVTTNAAATDSHADPSRMNPLAALVDSKGHGGASQRPTYVAPGPVSPGRRWAAASKAVSPGPTSASMDAIVAKLGGGTSPDVAPAAPPPPAPQASPVPAPKPVAKARAKRGADADLQAASASDALARAQLEAALR